MRSISFVLKFLLTTLMLLALPIASYADFTQIYGKYDSYSVFAPSSTYNPNLALLSAAASEDVYLSDGHSTALENAGFNNFKFISTPNDTQAMTAVKQFPAEGKRVIAIAFRGTTPSAMLDVVIDLAAFGTIFRPDHNQDNVIVHQGFWISMMDYYAKESTINIDGINTLDKVIADKNANDIFFISGHSLGGAIATLYSAMLIERGIKPENIITYTFGAPAVGNEAFATTYDNKLNLHRVRNLYDPVPYVTYLARLLNFIYGFKQIGIQTVYNNNVLVNPQNYQTPSIYNFIKDDHKMIRYKFDLGWVSNGAFPFATTVPTSVVVSDTLTSDEPKKYYKFTVATPGRYLIYTSGTTTTEAALYDSNYSTLLSVIRLNGEQNNFRMDVSLTAGTYYLEIKGLYPNPTGNYRLHVDGPGAGTQTDRDDHGLSAWNATPVTVGSVTNGIIDVPGDEDFFKFTVTTPGRYLIYTSGTTTTEAALYDSNYLTLLSVIRLNGEQNNFRMDVSLTAGTYYLEIKGLYPNPTGNYRLHVDGPGAGTQTDRDDHGLSAWNATPVTVGSVTNGIIDVPGDEDFFKFTVTTPGRYLIYTSGTTTTEAALYDSNYLTLLSVIRLNGEQNNFRMDVSLTAGTYYLEIKGLYPNPTGNYQLYIDGPVLQNLSINGPASLYASTAASYAAIASWNNNPTTTVSPTWSVSPSTYASISSDGVLTALVVPSNQAVIITASFTAYGVTKTATKLVTISKNTSVPTITTFTLPATSVSLTVPVTFTAVDNVSVTGYLLAETAAVPTASTSGWGTTAPTSYTFSTPGSKKLYAWAKDATGNISTSKSASTTITTTTTGPTLTLSTLANGAITNNATLNISGTVSDTSGVNSLKINNANVIVTSDSFSHAVTLQAGTNTITTIATDILGNQTTDIRTITLDQSAPVLTVTTPADNSKTAQPLATVTGIINETSTVKVNIGTLQNASITGNAYSATVNLAGGINTITITATDLGGNTSSAVRTVTYDNTNPSLAITDPNQDITTAQNSLTISGTVSDTINNATVTITFNNQTYTPAVTNGTFSQQLTIPAEGTYAITATATDEAGNSSSVTRNVVYTPPALLHSGDLNSDSQVNISDALMALRIAVSLIPMDTKYLADGDVAPYINGKPQPDQKIDISDALVILKKCVGLVNW